MKTKQKGFSLIELLVVVAVILILAAIAIPNFIKSTYRAHEASAIGSLRTINTSCQSYTLTYGTGFPASLAVLGPAPIASSIAADLIDSTLASGNKSGYSFSYSAAAPVNGIINGYEIVATPLTQGVTGQRGFFTDQTLVIRGNVSGTAAKTDAPIS